MTTRENRVTRGLRYIPLMVGAVHKVEATIIVPREWFAGMTDEEINTQIAEALAEVEAERDL